VWYFSLCDLPYFSRSVVGVDDNGLLLFHEHGRKVLSWRFQVLKNTIDSVPGMKLLNSLNSTGGYAWIHCEGPPTCQEEFNKVNITGISGTSFGASNQGKKIQILKSKENNLTISPDK